MKPVPTPVYWDTLRHQDWTFHLAATKDGLCCVTLPNGTPLFQIRVWRALLEIPFGSIRSYTDLAAYVGHPAAVRAVAAACGANPLPIVVPCHRVIGKGGRLTVVAAWR